jgi:hypothetical protein
LPFEHEFCGNIGIFFFGVSRFCSKRGQGKSHEGREAGGDAEHGKSALKEGGMKIDVTI